MNQLKTQGHMKALNFTIRTAVRRLLRPRSFVFIGAALLAGASLRAAEANDEVLLGRLKDASIRF
jgi:hypothetical protein